jgi:hypothetical protein
MGGYHPCLTNIVHNLKEVDTLPAVPVLDILQFTFDPGVDALNSITAGIHTMAEVAGVAGCWYSMGQISRNNLLQRRGYTETVVDCLFEDLRRKLWVFGGLSPVLPVEKNPKEKMKIETRL